MSNWVSPTYQQVSIVNDLCYHKFIIFYLTDCFPFTVKQKQAEKKLAELTGKRPGRKRKNPIDVNVRIEFFFFIILQFLFALVEILSTFNRIFCDEDLLFFLGLSDKIFSIRCLFRILY